MKKFIIILSLAIFSLLGVSANNAEAATTTKYTQVIFEVEGNYYSLERLDYLFGVIDAKKVGKTLPKYGFVEINKQKYARLDYLFGVIDAKKENKDVAEILKNSKPATISNVKAGKLAKDFSIMDKTATDNTVAPPPVVKEFKVVDIK